MWRRAIEGGVVERSAELGPNHRPMINRWKSFLFNSIHTSWLVFFYQFDSDFHTLDSRPAPEYIGSLEFPFRQNRFVFFFSPPSDDEYTDPEYSDMTPAGWLVRLTQYTVHILNHSGHIPPHPDRSLGSRFHPRGTKPLAILSGY